ncbi:hypothetical protein EHQ61_03915 [Leptospira wolffii]|uniref:hypothetical protein n=1 Tax=Leptospira wolffii TaxID=409998 RepID=UPI0010844BBB|nr:hypothetical protein [Leptospira wolffii]TGL53803.1 hypothetical protein EHQ61_03915 [Leptospira wolffii]
MNIKPVRNLFFLILIPIFLLLQCGGYPQAFLVDTKPASSERASKLSFFPKLKIEYACGRSFHDSGFPDSPSLHTNSKGCQDIVRGGDKDPFFEELLRSFTDAGWVRGENLFVERDYDLLLKINLDEQILYRGTFASILNIATLGFAPAVDRYRFALSYEILDKKGNRVGKFSNFKSVNVYWSSVFLFASPFLELPGPEFEQAVKILGEDSILKGKESGFWR